MLNAQLHPTIPEQGSVGASGDLAPLAHLALSLIGEGTLHRGAESGPADELLRRCGLTPIVLGPKEGLTLINGTQAHTAIGALAVADADVLWRVAHLAGAASLDALLGTPVAFDARIQDARGQVGQRRSAALLRTLLEGSEIRESHRTGDPRVQDAYALRCMPQVHGPARDAIDFAEAMIARELNAATDNPLIFDDGDMLSGGNFHGQAVALALDVLAIALTNLATISERRIDRLRSDAYALRCMPQVHGPARDAIDFAEAMIARELNAATDNPLIFDDGDMLSGGNFHGQAVALALDVLAIALTNLATISERRIDRL